jgi:hypothetical protein
MINRLKDPTSASTAIKSPPVIALRREKSLELQKSTTAKIKHSPRTTEEISMHGEDDSMVRTKGTMKTAIATQ